MPLFLRKRLKEICGDEVIGEHGYKIKEDKLEEILWDLELMLIEADVAHEVVEAVLDKVRKNVLGGKIRRGISPSVAIELVLKSAIGEILQTYHARFHDIVKDLPLPRIIMFVGVNGTGKTTVIAKMAYYLRNNGHSLVMGAADTFRAGAIEQLMLHGQKLGVKVVAHRAGADPAAVAYDAVEHAKARGKDYVLIDTAGRMQTNKNLMDEMAKIKRVVSPHLVIFVGDALTGNDAVAQARMFNSVVGITGIIMTKLDADTKGGAVVSVPWVIKKPILFVSVGQDYDKFLEFDPAWMLDRIFA